MFCGYYKAPSKWSINKEKKKERRHSLVKRRLLVRRTRAHYLISFLNKCFVLSLLNSVSLAIVSTNHPSPNRPGRLVGRLRLSHDSQNWSTIHSPFDALAWDTRLRKRSPTKSSSSLSRWNNHSLSCSKMHHQKLDYIWLRPDRSHQWPKRERNTHTFRFVFSTLLFD